MSSSNHTTANSATNITNNGISHNHAPHQSHTQASRKASEVNSAKSFDDFVSADVNEVLQDAREILTNREHRRDEHPNERVLDESTTVRVTKKGGDEDPMEVTVLRKRLVRRRDEPREEAEQEEDRGYKSDTDVVAATQRNRMPSIHQCSHRRVHTSIDDISSAAETTSERRHTNVVYRRRHKNDLWRKQDLDAEEAAGNAAEKLDTDEAMTDADEAEEPSSEDDVQLKVEITEQCRHQEGTHFVEQTWETTWSVQNFHALPDWLQDNEFLHTGHRPPLPSFAMCFKSILSVHTETGNIWTHLIGCLAFFFIFLWFMTRPDTHIQFQEKLVFSFFFAGAILCLGLSFVFHTVSCHSKFVVRIFSRLDYMGISLLIVGSFIPWIYYGFYCRREPKITYIAIIAVMGLGAIIVSLWDKFNDKRYRPLRAGIFSCMGCSGIVPTLHFIYTDGMRRLIDENSFYWILAMAVLYLFGALLYATRTPERFFPGKCDLLFQSHQLFHVCVVCAALAHYYGISNMAMNRLTGTCPGANSPIQSGAQIVHNEL